MLVAEIEGRCPCVPVHPRGALDGTGLEPLQALGEGRTAALVGSSGVGKSTLGNRLLGGEEEATSALADHGRGRHTTTHRQLHRLPGGGLLLDSPGRHEGEPGCAVAAAITAGELDPARLEHSHKLEREAHTQRRRQDERLRREGERRWGHLMDEAKRRMRLKRGDWG